MGLVISAIELGSIYAVMALGIYITYKILDFPDLTVDGSFPFGAAVSAAMLSRGVNPLLAMLVSVIAGCIAGFCTGVIHVKCKVRDLLSGIIMMTALYSVNFIIVGKANLPVQSENATVFSNGLVNGIFGKEAPLGFMYSYKTIIVMVVVLIIAKVLLDLYLKTRSGYLLRAVGNNENVISVLGKDPGNVKILGLTIANGFVALAGSLYCQYMRAFNLTDGTGKMVIGLASVIIGINIFGKIRFFKNTTSVVIGSIIYTACVSLALKQFDSNIKNLVTAVLFLIVLVLGKFGTKRKSKGMGVKKDA